MIIQLISAYKKFEKIKNFKFYNRNKQLFFDY